MRNIAANNYKARSDRIRHCHRHRSNLSVTVNAKQVRIGPASPDVMTEEMETNTAKLFALMDANRNGFVVEKELQRHLTLAGISLAKDRHMLPNPGKNFRPGQL